MILLSEASHIPNFLVQGLQNPITARQELELTEHLQGSYTVSKSDQQWLPEYTDKSEEEGDDRHVESCGDQSSRHWQAARASDKVVLISFKIFFTHDHHSFC